MKNRHALCMNNASERNKGIAMNFEENNYENAAHWAVDNFVDADQQRFATLADKVPINVRTLLDVGCGNGLFLKHLNETKGRNFERLCGTDRSKAALACVQAEKVQASVESLPFKNDEFDAVSCSEVLEHLPQDTFIRALTELSRIASRYILVSVPFNEDLRMSLIECAKCRCRFHSYYHLRSFTSETIQSLFAEKGFSCREVFHIHPERIVPAEIEMFLRLIGKAKRKIFREPRVPMDINALCPACGYSPCAFGNDKLRLAKPSKNHAGISHAIRSILSLRTKSRWIGALYEYE